MVLAVPSLVERNANFNTYLPASANHPKATEAFRREALAPIRTTSTSASGTSTSTPTCPTRKVL